MAPPWTGDFFIAWGLATGPQHLLGGGRGGAEVGDRHQAGHRAGAVHALPLHHRLGANIHGNNVHLWPFIAEARRKGAKLVVIDPYRTRTAACADWYLPINPGTDAALALGMMHVIISEDLHDADYVARYTLGFDQLREKVKEYPPERVGAMDGHRRRRHSSSWRANTRPRVRR